jgi:hypothetical protein
MHRLKFTLLFIKEFIKENPWKLSFILTFAILWQVAKNIDDVPVQKEVVHTYEHKGNTIYIVRGDDSDGDIDYGIREYIGNEERAEIDENGFIHETKSHGGFIVTIVIMVILALIVIAGTFDDDGGWELSRIYKNCLYKQIERREDNKEIYYVYRDRVLATQIIEDIMYTPPSLGQYELKERLEDCRLNPEIYPLYKGTREEVRDKKIGDVIG